MCLQQRKRDVYIVSHVNIRVKGRGERRGREEESVLNLKVLALKNLTFFGLDTKEKRLPEM